MTRHNGTFTGYDEAIMKNGNIRQLKGGVHIGEHAINTVRSWRRVIFINGARLELPMLPLKRQTNFLHLPIDPLVSEKFVHRQNAKSRSWNTI